MRGCVPREESNDLDLKDKDHAYTGVEAAKVCRHGGDGEGGSSDEIWSPEVLTLA